ncbi:MAG: NAD(P)/FAD-dependent oxidoreductase, partial [Kiloniellales bacterium]|nr:NAD(P)/FAD-dependent oxidoreductase [Kiloniellales bacterium]
PAGAIEQLYSLGMEEKIREANFYAVDKLLLSSPRGYVVEANLKPGPKFGADSYVVPRLKFDALIQEHAVDSGAEFRKAQVKETIVEDGRVIGVRARSNGSMKEIGAKVVIGADGVTSVVARSLRPDKHQDKHKAVALRAYIEDIEELPKEVEFYLYKGILPGYAWIFPIGEGRANIGLGMRLDKFRGRSEGLEEMLDVFLGMPEIRQRLKNGGSLKDIAVWQLNFGSQDMRRAYDGALLIGDAAGLINPLTGGGISNGLISARIAAEVVSQAVREGDTSLGGLQTFDALCDDAMRHGMRRSYTIQRTLLYFPIWVDLLIRSTGSNSELAQTFIDKL